MESCEVKIRNYVFRFKRLRWRDEFAIKFEKKRDPYRTMLAYALLEVSGLPVTPEEARKVIDALPYAIMERAFKIWKASFPPSRHFVTGGLYKAPDPLEHQEVVAKELKERDAAIDPAIKQVEQQFGSEQLEEAKEISRKILEASNLRGAVRASNNGV